MRAGARTDRAGDEVRRAVARTPNLSNTLGLPLLAYCNTVLQKGSFIQLYPFSVLEGSLAKSVANVEIQKCARRLIQFALDLIVRFAALILCSIKMILMPLSLSLFI